MTEAARDRTSIGSDGSPFWSVPADALLASLGSSRDGLTQAEAAARMEVSRSTFQRILDAGHRKVALALTGGKALFIQGGTFEVEAAGYDR